MLRRILPCISLSFVFLLSNSALAVEFTGSADITSTNQTFNFSDNTTEAAVTDGIFTITARGDYDTDAPGEYLNWYIDSVSSVYGWGGSNNDDSWTEHAYNDVEWTQSYTIPQADMNTILSDNQFSLAIINSAEVNDLGSADDYVSYSLQYNVAPPPNPDPNPFAGQVAQVAFTSSAELTSTEQTFNFSDNTTEAVVTDGLLTITARGDYDTDAPGEYLDWYIDSVSSAHGWGGINNDSMTEHAYNDMEWTHYYLIPQADMNTILSDNQFSLTIMNSDEVNDLGSLDDNVSYTLEYNFVPEPSTMLLLGIGMASLACRRRRK